MRPVIKSASASASPIRLICLSSYAAVGRDMTPQDTTISRLRSRVPTADPVGLSRPADYAHILFR